MVVPPATPKRRPPPVDLHLALPREHAPEHPRNPTVIEETRQGPDAMADARGELRVENLEVVYDDVMLVLRGVSVQVRRGRSSRCSARTAREDHTAASARRDCSTSTTGRSPRARSAWTASPSHRLRPPPRWCAAASRQVMEGRRIFAELTVEENLRLGAHPTRAAGPPAMERAYTLFPVLARRRRDAAGYLSGGEQQMLAIGTGADGAAAVPAARRAESGSGAEAGRADPRPHRRDQRAGHGSAAGRAERDDGAVHRHRTAT